MLKRLTPISTEVPNDSDRWYLRHVRRYRTSDNRIDGVVVTFADVTGLKRTTEQLEQRERQQAALAELGAQGLANANLNALFKQACRILRDTLDVEYTKVLELLPDRSGCLLRAGVGCRRGLVGKAKVSLTFPPKGARCTIELPASQLAEATQDNESHAAPSGESRAAANGAGSTLAKRRIIVVEDSTIVVSEIASVLKE